MSVFRVYPSKSNTIAGSYFSNINSGQNSVTDLWYGGGGTNTSPEKRNSFSRFLIYFDLTDLQQKFNSKEINESLVTSYKLKLTNSKPRDLVLEDDYEYDVLFKKVATSFDLIAFPINKYWEEGRGYDLTKEIYIVRQKGNYLISGVSNWNYATAAPIAWDEPGIYTNPTGYTFSGSVIESGMTISTKTSATDLDNPTYFNFVTTPITGMGLSISANTIETNIFVDFNPLSGDVSTSDWKNIVNTTTFSGYQISITNESTSIYINSAETTTFTLSADTPIPNVNYYSTQHFDIGNEDVDMDVTDIVKDWLSGGSENYGIAIAYRRDYELLSTDTRYICSFFTEKTNTAFKPCLEVVYNQVIQDDRKQVSNNRPSNLFLYTFSGHNFANINLSAVTVDIKKGNALIYTGLTPNQLSTGTYYINVWMSGATAGEKYTDVWNNVSFNPPYDNQNIEQTFQIQKDYYTSSKPSINEYVLEVYGVEQGKIVHQDEKIRVYCDLRVNYSINKPTTSYSLQYRIIMNNQVEVIPWTEVNQAVIDDCKINYFDLDASWLLHNQTYQVSFKINEMGTSRVMPERIDLKVIKPF